MESRGICVRLPSAYNSIPLLWHPPPLSLTRDTPRDFSYSRVASDLRPLSLRDAPLSTPARFPCGVRVTAAWGSPLRLRAQSPDCGTLLSWHPPLALWLTRVACWISAAALREWLGVQACTRRCVK